MGWVGGVLDSLLGLVGEVMEELEYKLGPTMQGS